MSIDSVSVGRRSMTYMPMWIYAKNTNNTSVNKWPTLWLPKGLFQNSAQERLGSSAMLFLLVTHVSHTWSNNQKQSISNVIIAIISCASYKWNLNKWGPCLQEEDGSQAPFLYFSFLLFGHQIFLQASFSVGLTIGFFIANRQHLLNTLRNLRTPRGLPL